MSSESTWKIQDQITFAYEASHSFAFFLSCFDSKSQQIKLPNDAVENDT